jgi:hypothetical protein
VSDLDRILADDPVIEPSANFAARVMARVREEATAPPPIEFPWRRFLPGAITGAAAVLIVFGLIVANFDAAELAAQSAASPGPALDIAILQQPPVVAVLALAGSLALAWLTLRFTAGSKEHSF